MRPCSLVVHIASSSLAHVGKQTSCCFICEEKLQTVRAMWPNTQRGLTSSILSNQSTVGGEKAHKQCSLTLERGRTPTTGTTQNYGTDTHTHSYTANLISSGRYPYTHTNTCINHQPPPTPNTVIHKQQIHTQHTPNQTDCQTGSHYFDPDGKWWLFWWQLSHLT